MVHRGAVGSAHMSARSAHPSNHAYLADAAQVLALHGGLVFAVVHGAENDIVVTTEAMRRIKCYSASCRLISVEVTFVQLNR